MSKLLKVTDNDDETSLLTYLFYYNCKKFYDTGPQDLFFFTFTFSTKKWLMFDLRQIVLITLISYGFSPFWFCYEFWLFLVEASTNDVIISLVRIFHPVKVAGVKVYPRQTWNFRSHAVSACISLWHHRLMHAPYKLMHACTAYIAPWCHRLMHAVTSWTLLFWFCLGSTFISSYFVTQ